MTNKNEGIGEATGRIVVAPGVVGPSRIAKVAWGTASLRNPLHLKLDIRFANGRYVLHALSRDTDIDDAPGITGEALRECPVDIVVRVAVLSHVKDEPNPRGDEPWGRIPPADVVTERNVTDRLMLWVAHLWTIGNVLEGKGTKYVETYLGVPRSRAARWVGFARERGFLDPAPRRD